MSGCILVEVNIKSITWNPTRENIDACLFEKYKLQRIN